jgi:hypothetical protein
VSTVCCGTLRGRVACGRGWCQIVGVEVWEQWQEVERRRRQMAERLALTLANLPPGGTGGDGVSLVLATAVEVRLASVPEFGIALSDAPRMIALGSREFRRFTGAGGVVFLVHTENSSVVFPFMPWTRLVLLCDDDVPDHCLRVFLGDPDTVVALDDFCTEVTMALETRTQLIAAGSLAPDIDG